MAVRCRPAQAGPARRHKTRLTAPTPRPKPQASEPGHPTRQASRSPRIRRNGPLAPRSAPQPGRRRPHISQSQTRTRRPAPRSGLRSHHINKHGITLPARSSSPRSCGDGSLRSAHGRPSSGRDPAGIRPGSPRENGLIESFHARLRDELRNGEIFHTLKEARILIEIPAPPRPRHASAQQLGIPTPSPGNDHARLAEKPPMHEPSHWTSRWGQAKGADRNAGSRTARPRRRMIDPIPTPSNRMTSVRKGSICQGGHEGRSFADSFRRGGFAAAGRSVGHRFRAVHLGGLRWACGSGPVRRGRAAAGRSGCRCSRGAASAIAVSVVSQAQKIRRGFQASIWGSGRRRRRFQG